MATRIGRSEAKRRLRASGRFAPYPPRSPRRRRCPEDRDSCICRRDPARPSPLVALCYHPLWADPPSYWAVRARILLADPLRVLRGGRPSHLIFRECPKGELRRITLPRTPGNRDKKNTGPPRRGETGEPGLVGNSNIYTNPTYTANR